uniref:EGF like domain multiple 6 n=1 Tax=Callithrix jacchus TaxID=9483 RepID=A0A5F4WEZ4_CALJA
MRGSCWRRVPARCARPAPPSLAYPVQLHPQRSLDQACQGALSPSRGRERPRRGARPPLSLQRQHPVTASAAETPSGRGERRRPLSCDGVRPAPSRGGAGGGGRTPAKMPLPWGLALPLLLPWVAGGFGNPASARDHGLLTSTHQPGVCHYGTRLACCYGWRRNSKGVCEATCEPGCKFGECVGPNKCRCFPGYTGKTCSQDMNECGMNPRPCQHRCVNTHGSYKCFCLSGHMLMPDATCVNSRTCAMTNCQYGCEDTEEGPQCLCPSSGLRLAPDGRVCLDIDECASGKAICPYNRRCVNTFGSYYCKCQVGFKLQYISGRYDCVDINECTMDSHTCSHHANCFNTQGSFKCKCKQGYKGNGFRCSAIPENSGQEVLRAPGTIKDRIKKLFAHKSSMKKKVQIKNVTPEPTRTPTHKANLQPFNHEESISRGGNSHGDKKGNEERMKEGFAEKKREEKALKNDIEQERSLRGDVFYLNVTVDCSFDHGICDWKQDREDDFDWNPADRDNAIGYYMAVPALAGHKKDIGRLKLLLPDLQPQSNFCLLFDYRLAGDKVGKLRVFVKNSNNVLAWEETTSKDGKWKTGEIQLYQGTDATKSIIFEAERGKGKISEIAVDGVLLVSGLCPDSLLSVED